MVNSAIERYFETLLIDDDDGYFRFLHYIYNGAFTEYIEDDKFVSKIRSIDPTDYLDNLNDMVAIRQEIEVEISYKIIEPYLNANAKLGLDTGRPISYKDYTYINTFENLEFYGDYNFLFVGNKLLLKLFYEPEKLHKCKIGVYNIHKATEIPSFIKNYSMETDIPKIPYKFDNTTIKINTFKENKFLLLPNRDEMDIPCMLCNIPYEYLKKSFRKTKSLYYDLGLKEFRFLNKNMDRVNELLNDFATNGIMSPLCLGVNSNGKIVEPAQCNIGFLLSLFLKFDEIPVILYYHPRVHYTNCIDSIRLDESSVYYANKAFDGNVIFNNKRKVDSEGYEIKYAEQ